MTLIQADPLPETDDNAEAGEAAPVPAVCTSFGRVAFVAGSQVVVLIDTPDSSDSGVGPDAGTGEVEVNIGALVKTESPVSTVYGIVCGVSITLPAEDPSQKDIMTVEIELLGEAPKSDDGASLSFRRGVSYPPLLNSRVWTTSKEDLLRVFAKPEAETARVGTIHQDPSVPAYIVTNDLLGKHFAIVGTTGCGKSTATTLILHAVIEQSPQSHIVLIDPHSEYSQAFSSRAEILDTDNLELPYWLLEFDELLGIIVGAGQKAGQEEIAILTEAIPAVKRQFVRSTDSSKRITVDTPVPYRLTDLIQAVDTAMGNLNNATGISAYQRLKNRLVALQNDPRYGFMFGGVTVRDNMEQIISRIFRIPVDGKPVSILDLSGVPSEVVNIVVSVLCRLTFDFALWGERDIPILLVCEEAHRYASKGSDPDFDPTRRTLSRIAKEGRKYGLSLCLISQRPAEMDSGILSQCNTVFAMRLANQQDQDIMRAIISDSSQGLFESLASLGNAEAIAVGDGIAVPMRLRFDNLPEDQRPRSETADFVTAWKAADPGADTVGRIVERWRWQQR